MSREIVLVSDEQNTWCDDTKVNSDCDKEQIGGKQNSDGNDSVSSVPFNDEDDVPSDFFDDFSNQDFMAGLDIVDAWDDEEDDLKKKPGSGDLNKEVNRGRNETSKRRRSRTPNRSNRYDRRYKRSRDRSKDSKGRVRKRKHKSKETRIKEHEGEEHKNDQRRDPEKTKRDIQKDKVKCAKDKEAQIIVEKLKVVETGLVPPGTEMEVDLKEIKEQHKKTEVITEERKKEKGGEERKSGKEEKANYREGKFNAREGRYVHERRRKSRSVSPEFRRSRYLPRTSRDREGSYERRLNRSPFRRRTRTRSRSRSPYRRRLSSERRYQLEERKRTNRYRDVSPLVIRRTSTGHSYDRSRSRNRSHSDVSEREMWLQKRDYKRDYKRDSKKSSSPTGEMDFKKYKRNKESFMEELVHILDSEKKKKFLKEIQERINEPVKVLSPHFPMVPPPLPVPPPVAGVPPNPMHCPPPQPGPGPGYIPNRPQFPFTQPPLVNPPPPVQYDQQFFIGQPDMFHNNGSYGHPIHSDLMEPAPPPIFSPKSIESPISINLLQPQNNIVDILKNQQTAEAQKHHQEAVAKLFEDKKISLSDFLSISAKPSDPSQPINVQKKVKVISLCQDAIKALGGDSKLNGRFFLKKVVKESEKKEESKYQSPIRKIPIVRFRFTTISKGGEDKSSLQSNLNKLLASLGLIEPPIVIKIEEPPTKPPESTTTKPASVADKPTSTRKYDPLLGSKFQMKMCQTDPVKCPVCEIRKACKFTNQGVQCAIKTVDIGTQITEEDMIRLGIKEPPVKDALKNQSLAHLTAAQILAAQNAVPDESPRKDLFSSTRIVSPPPPPNISPDRQNIRHNLSHSDSFPSRSFGNIDNVNKTPKKLSSIFDKIFPSSFEKRSMDNRPTDSRPIDNRSMDTRSMDNRAMDNRSIDNRSMDNRFMDDRSMDNRRMIDRSIPFENMNTMRSNFENRFESRFESPDFNSRMIDYDVEFEPPPDSYQREYLPNNRGNNFGSYGGYRY